MPDDPTQPAIALRLEEALIAALADAVADRLAQHLPPPSARVASPWLDVEGACAYTGLSKDALYKLTAARAIPCRKKAHGQGLRFHCDELNQWMEARYPRLDRLR